MIKISKFDGHLIKYDTDKKQFVAIVNKEEIRAISKRQLISELRRLTQIGKKAIIIASVKHYWAREIVEIVEIVNQIDEYNTEIIGHNEKWRKIKTKRLYRYDEKTFKLLQDKINNITKAEEEFKKFVENFNKY